MFYNKISRILFVFYFFSYFLLESSFCVYSSDSDSASESYDSDLELRRHKKAYTTFFNILSRNPRVHDLVDKFEEEITDGAETITSINIDGLSCRTRILLFKELIAFAKVKCIKIPFSINNKAFNIKLDPKLSQPGNGKVSTIEKYEDMVKLFKIYSSEYQRKISKKLRDSRRKNKPIKKSILEADGIRVDLNMINILWDFEVARRFQKEVPELPENTEQNNRIKKFNKRIRKNTRKLQGGTNIINRIRSQLDEIPIAPAIIAILKLSSRKKDQIRIESFLKAEEEDVIGKDPFPYGKLNVFEGAAIKERRMLGFKEIIRQLRSGSNESNHTCEQMRQDHIEYYGGSSESDRDRDRDEYSDVSDS